MVSNFRKLIRCDNAFAKLEDIKFYRDICFSCEYKTDKSNRNYRYTSCNCDISAKIIFIFSECPEGKLKTLDY